MKKELSSSVGVVGAGIQGVCISLFLIKKGFQVTLLDRDELGAKSASLIVGLVSKILKIRSAPAAPE